MKNTVIKSSIIHLCIVDHAGLSACLLHLVESLSVARVRYLIFHGAHFVLELL